MPTPRINLFVLRVADINRSADFYRALGLDFVKHAHSTGSLHYSCELNGAVFELYPAMAKQCVSSSARIGFTVSDVDKAVEVLARFPGAELVAAPADSDWGRRAVVADPDGHRVELLTDNIKTDV